MMRGRTRPSQLAPAYAAMPASTARRTHPCGRVACSHRAAAAVGVLVGKLVS